MVGGFEMPDARDNLKNDTRRSKEETQKKEIERNLQEMTARQLQLDLEKRKDRDSKERKNKLMILLQKILNSFKNNASNMSESDVSDISKAGNRNNNHGETAKAK